MLLSLVHTSLDVACMIERSSHCSSHQSHEAGDDTSQDHCAHHCLHVTGLPALSFETTIPNLKEVTLAFYFFNYQSTELETPYEPPKV